MNPEDYETLPTNNVLSHMTAGAIAGVMEHCVMYPLDSVKTRMQSLTRASEGVFQTFTRMVETEGLLRPVRGLSAMIVGAGPSHALYFSSYEYLKDKMALYSSSNIIYGAAGCISTVLHDGIMNPAEVVKQRLQMYNSPYASVSECVTRVYRTEGISAFYRSYTTQLTMNIPFQSIHFMVYEFMQQLTNKDHVYNPRAHMVSGALAGAVAAAITTPLDVCKTLLNTQQVGGTNGLLQAVGTVYKLGGIPGFFRGVQARVMYQMPATAICWSTYEFFKYVIVQNRLDDVRLVPQATTVFAEESCNDRTTSSPNSSSSSSSSCNLKPREIPAMSAAGIYGSLSYNTMHSADASFRQDSSMRHA